MKTENIKKDIDEILISSRKIKKQLKIFGKRIDADYAGLEPVLISILKGSVIFLSDLLKNIHIKCSVDFIALSSYQGNRESSGIVKLVMDLRESIEGRHVILVEDIVDTGLTMAYIRDNLLTRHPASFRICSLLSKKESRKTKINIDYKGFEIPNKFVVGYGLDYMENYRNLNCVATLKSEVLNE
ncbi:MAG: hypoxanthine phosphoribosyltransferase [Elusimicrobiota bacterium]